MSRKKAYKKKTRKAGEWKERFEEVSGYLSHYLEETRYLERENQYLREYICWKGLDDEFALFMIKAHEEQSPDEPLPRLVM